MLLYHVPVSCAPRDPRAWHVPGLAARAQRCMHATHVLSGHESDRACVRDLNTGTFVFLDPSAVALLYLRNWCVTTTVACVHTPGRGPAAASLEPAICGPALATRGRLVFRGLETLQLPSSSTRHAQASRRVRGSVATLWCVSEAVCCVHQCHLADADRANANASPNVEVRVPVGEFDEGSQLSAWRVLGAKPVLMIKGVSVVQARNCLYYTHTFFMCSTPDLGKPNATATRPNC